MLTCQSFAWAAAIDVAGMPPTADCADTHTHTHTHTHTRKIMYMYVQRYTHTWFKFTILLSLSFSHTHTCVYIHTHGKNKQSTQVQRWGLLGRDVVATYKHTHTHSQTSTYGTVPREEHCWAETWLPHNNSKKKLKKIHDTVHQGGLLSRGVVTRHSERVWSGEAAHAKRPKRSTARTIRGLFGGSIKNKFDTQIK